MGDLFTLSIFIIGMLYILLRIFVAIGQFIGQEDKERVVIALIILAAVVVAIFLFEYFTKFRPLFYVHQTMNQSIKTG